MIAFPSALSAEWETNGAAESELHLHVVLEPPGLEKIPGHTAAESDDHSAPAHTKRILASASDEALHLLPCYKQRCCCDRCLRSGGTGYV